MELGHDSSAGAGRCSAVSCSCGNGRQKVGWNADETRARACAGLCGRHRIYSSSSQSRSRLSASALSISTGISTGQARSSFPWNVSCFRVGGGRHNFYLILSLFPSSLFPQSQTERAGMGSRQAGMQAVVRGRLRGICVMNTYHWH